MKTFLAVYMGSTSGEKMQKWNAQDEATRSKKQQEGMTAWMQWGMRHENIIVDNGGPLGKTKLVNAKGIADTKNLLTGYVIVKAETAEAAAQLFINHPHFSIFPGESVEVIECLPMPGGHD